MDSHSSAPQNYYSDHHTDNQWNPETCSPAGLVPICRPRSATRGWPRRATTTWRNIFINILLYPEFLVACCCWHCRSLSWNGSCYICMIYWASGAWFASLSRHAGSTVAALMCTVADANNAGIKIECLIRQWSTESWCPRNFLDGVLAMIYLWIENNTSESQSGSSTIPSAKSSVDTGVQFLV
jgi:hypothetical protein